MSFPVIKASSLEDAMNVCRIETSKRLVDELIQISEMDEKYRAEIFDMLFSEFEWWVPKGLKCEGVAKE
jgi:hypothetical protein